MTRTINKHQHPLHFICLLILTTLINNPLLAGEVYKWTDASGETHYSDIKPNGTESKSLNLRTQVSKPQLHTPQERAVALDGRKQKELETDKENRKQLEDQKKTNEFCTAVRSNLKKVTEKSRLQIIDNGERRFLSPEEIASKKLEYQKQLKENC